MSVLLFPIILKVKDLSRCLACCRLFYFCFTKITCRDCQNQQTIDMFDSKVKKNRVDKGTLCHTPKKICLEKSVVPPVARKKIGSSYPRHAQNGGISFNGSGPGVPVQRPGCEIWWCESCGNLGAETAGTCSIWLQQKVEMNQNWMYNGVYIYIYIYVYDKYIYILIYIYKYIHI